MAHAAQQKFFAWIAEQFPDHFVHCRVLDCGSLDVNGTLKPLFEHCNYIGVDQFAGPNVDVQTTVVDAPFEPGSFDTVVSAEMLEHDEEWRRSLRAMVTFLRPGGLLALSTATIGRAEHGTVETPEGADYPNAGVWSPGNYYRNLTEDEVLDTLDVDQVFCMWGVQVEDNHHDLYVWGLKR